MHNNSKVKSRLARTKSRQSRIHSILLVHAKKDANQSKR